MSKRDAWNRCVEFGRIAPVVNVESAQSLNIKAHPTGLRRGWFNWPYNFDPAWLQACDGFAAEKDSSQ